MLIVAAAAVDGEADGTIPADAADIPRSLQARHHRREARERLGDRQRSRASPCVTISCFTTLTTSTTGLAPVTVTACSIAPTCRSTLIVAVKFALSSMPSRRTTENPGSVKVTRVGARPQVDDPVDAFAVRDRRARLLDERGAGRFHRDARQDARRWSL